MRAIFAFQIVFALLVLGISNSVGADSGGHPPCKIQYEDDGEITADCGGLKMTSVPSSLPCNVTRLNLSRNSIADVTTDAPLRQYQRLRVLDISRNLVVNVDGHVFPESLQDLDLSYNNLSQVCQDKVYLPNLQHLCLDENNINTLTADCFSGVASLKNLSLSHNHLATLPDYTFRGLHHLTSLNLDHNVINQLQPEAFTGLGQLRTLSLAFNQLDSSAHALPPNVFRQVGATLTTLYLHGNQMGNDGEYPEDAFSDLVALETLKIDTFHYTGKDTIFGPGFGAMRRLQELDLSHQCSLNELRNTTFAVFANSSLHTLRLSNLHTRLNYLEACVFCPLKSLTSLYIDNAVSFGPTLPDLMAASYAFRLNGNEVQIINAHSFQPTYGEHSGVHLTESTLSQIQHVCVREVNLRNNLIVFVAFSAFNRPGVLFSKCIRHLDLSYNAIFSTDYGMMFPWRHHYPELRTFQFQQQRRYDLEFAARALSKRTSPGVPTIQVYVTLPPKLEFVNLSGADIGNDPVQANIISGGSLKTLDLSYFSRYISCTSVFTGLENLENFNISGNRCQNISQSFFDSFPRLKTLTLQRMSFSAQVLTHMGKRLFSNLTQLQTLDLSFNDFERFPPDLLSRQRALQQLLLADSNLDSCDLEFDYHDELRVLDLSKNRLSVLSDTARESLDRLVARQQQPVHLRLQDNPLACTCATLNFMRWLMETRVELDGGGDYPCITDTGELSSTRTVGKQWMNAWRACVGPTALWWTVAIMMLLVSVTGAVWGVTKNMTRIRFMYTVFTTIKMPTRRQFQRDAYVAYCDADTEFVCLRLKRELQQRRRVRLLIKDLPMDEAGMRFYQLPGDNIALKMLQHIDMCWKVILVLTPALTRDPFRGLMTRLVLGSITDRLPRRVLLLCVGVREVPGLASLRPLLEAVPESQVFFLPHPASRDPRVWNGVANAVLQDL